MPSVASKEDSRCYCRKTSIIADTFRCDKCHAWIHTKCDDVTLDHVQSFEAYFAAEYSESRSSVASTIQPLLELHKTVLEEFRATNANLNALSSIVTDLVGRIDTLVSRVDKLESEKPPPDPENTEVALLVARAIDEQESRKRKQCRAVIERMPESEDDIEKVTELARKCGSDSALVSEQIHRHGGMNGNSSNPKPKIIKVPFTSKMARDQFIQSFWTNARDPTFRKAYSGVSVRRDLTPDELKVHHSLRSECYHRNKECGLFKFLYRDLRIIELSNPKPLKTEA
ncbi:Protein Y73B6BL.16 [Aphelenchoides avenae]|nr:Protein Y73B6BL.16 [Aphelenchus avenae]